jgi:hypothetical protein
VEAARCRFGASASSDVTINRGDEASEGDIALSAENSAFGGRTDFVNPTPVRHPKSILWPNYQDRGKHRNHLKAHRRGQFI